MHASTKISDEVGTGEEVKGHGVGENRQGEGGDGIGREQATSKQWLILFNTERSFQYISKYVFFCSGAGTRTYL